MRGELPEEPNPIWDEVSGTAPEKFEYWSVMAHWRSKTWRYLETGHKKNVCHYCCTLVEAQVEVSTFS